MALSHFIRTNRFSAIVLMALMGWFIPPPVQAIAQEDVSATRSVDSKTSNVNRLQFTRYGWQDVNYWIVRPQSEIGLDRIHPITMGALMLLGVLTLVIWSANEVEISDLFGRHSKTRRATNKNRQPDSLPEI